MPDFSLYFHMFTDLHSMHVAQHPPQPLTRKQSMEEAALLRTRTQILCPLRTDMMTWASSPGRNRVAPGQQATGFGPDVLAPAGSILRSPLGQQHPPKNPGMTNGSIRQPCPPGPCIGRSCPARCSTTWLLMVFFLINVMCAPFFTPVHFSRPLVGPELHPLG